MTKQEANLCDKLFNRSGNITVLLDSGGVMAVYRTMEQWGDGSLGSMGREIVAEVKRKKR